MTTFIEKDALSGASFDLPTAVSHPHELKSFIATPRHDPTLMERFRSLFKSELKPGQYITKGADGLRYMFIITSNSYEDRDDETITSKALEEYEASCYPGEDLFHCDNPLLWWHDDDIPMGEIVAVNYSTPFLVEVAKELPSPTARIIWDFAEKNGDNAGASHRFGYRDEDRQPDGSFTHIFKQETSYLPERNLAANIMTYAGVIDKNMSTTQSDKRITEMFAAATAGKIQEAADEIHANSGAFNKKLASLGFAHKAKADAPPEDELPADGEEKPVDDEAKAETPAEFGKWLDTMNQIYTLVMALVEAQSGLDAGMGTMSEETLALKKSFEALKEKEKAAAESLEKRIALLEARQKLTPRSAQQNMPATDIENLTKSLETAQIQATNADLVDSPVGKIKPPIKYT